jgi:hypothetical protein
MSLLNRRLFLGLMLAAPALGPGRALAAYPLKERPERVRTLGTWGLVDRAPDVDAGQPVTVHLGFRPLIDVDEPVMRFWIPRWDPVQPARVRKTCVPTNLPHTTVLDPMTAGVNAVISLDLDTRQPDQPNNVMNGDQLAQRQREALATQPTLKRRRAYRVYVEMADPTTCRRAEFSFNLTLLDAYPPQRAV